MFFMQPQSARTKRIPGRIAPLHLVVAISLAFLLPARSFLYAANISLSGRTVDEAGEPVAEVEIGLIDAGIATTSGSDGTFMLSGAGRKDRAGHTPVHEPISIRSGTLVVRVAGEPARVSAHLFDCRGRFLQYALDSLFSAGRHSVALKAPGAGAGLSLMKVRMGSHSAIARFVNGRFAGAASSRPVSRSSVGTARRAEGHDTLEIAAGGFMTKRLHVEKFDTSLGDLVLFEKNLGLNTGSYPRVDGSTSAHPLGVIIACRLLNTSYGWNMYFDGTQRAQAYSSLHPARADSINSEIVIHNGTHGSYVNLIEKQADLVLAARMPSEGELDLAASRGVELDPQAVAYDGFVFIVNTQNPVDSLALETVRSIYTGTVTRWDSVGGPAWNIQPYQRNPNSGSQELMLSMVMKDMPIIDAPYLILHGMMGPINRLPGDSAGIAYTVYFFKSFMAPHPQIKMIGIDGVMPTFETIQSKSYPLWNEVYAVIRKDQNRESAAFRLRRLLLSPEGQAIVRESGYVTLGVDRVE